MASFFQPPLSGDPAIENCNNNTPWEIYCNSILPGEDRLVTPVQWFTFVLAVVALGIPTLLYLGDRSLKSLRLWNKSRKRCVQNYAWVYRGPTLTV